LKLQENWFLRSILSASTRVLRIQPALAETAQKAVDLVPLKDFFYFHVLHCPKDVEPKHLEELVGMQPQQNEQFINFMSLLGSLACSE